MHFLEKKLIFIENKISLKHVPSGPVDDNHCMGSDNGLPPAGESHDLGQVCPGLLTHSGVTRPQLVASNQRRN